MSGPAGRGKAQAERARPFVAVNFALTFDGKISTRQRTPSDFSSQRDKRRLLEIRAGGDAVLVGRGTLEKENMSMGLPVAELRAARLRRHQPEVPLRVIISNSGRLNPALRVFKKGAPVVVYSTRQMPRRTQLALAPLADLQLHDGAAVDLSKMLTHLHTAYRVRRLICEGGPALLRTLLASELVDELNVTFCPRIFGGEKALTLTGLPSSFLPHSWTARLVKMEVIGEECFLRYRLARSLQRVPPHVST